MTESEFLAIRPEFEQIACSNPGLIAAALGHAALFVDPCTYGNATAYATAAYAAQWLARSSCGRTSGMVLEDGSTIYDADIAAFKSAYALSVRVI
jgi:hypothetical protein